MVGGDLAEEMGSVKLDRAFSQLVDRCEPVHVFTHPFADREDHVDDSCRAALSGPVYTGS